MPPHPKYTGSFLSCRSIIADNGTPEFYNLLDRMHCQGVKAYVGVDGTMIKLEDGEPLPDLTPTEALVLKMFVNQFHRH